MKRILAWIMALCMALICVPLTATARAEDSASRASKYDYYCYMPNVYSDEITVTMADGTQYIYTIIDTKIYESTDELRLPAADGKKLVLVTCYPFHYSGSAPGKYMVQAHG